MSVQHKPTKESKQRIEKMAGFGLPHEQIGAVVNIDAKTLRKYYRHELDRGKAIANVKIAETLFHKATEDKDTAALIWWTKCQMGWTDKRREEEREIEPLTIRIVRAEKSLPVNKKVLSID